MKSWIKKTSITILIGIVILFLGVIVIPFFIDVDKYRPELLKLASEHINGTLKLGKLSLSLWGKIKIKSEEFLLQDAKGQKVAYVKDVYFELPCLSLLVGKPKSTIIMFSPEIRVIRDINGKINLLSLMKETAQSPKETLPSKEQTGKEPNAFIKNFSLSLKIYKAKLRYLDIKSKFNTNIDEFDLEIKNLSLKEPINIIAQANLDSNFKNMLSIKGPIRIAGEIKTHFDDKKFVKASLRIQSELGKLNIAAANYFKKTESIPASINGEMDFGTDKVNIHKFQLLFNDAILNLYGTVDGLQSKEVAHNMKLESSEIDFSLWKHLIPILKDYEIAGKVNLKAYSQGKLNDPHYNGKFVIKNLTLESGNLKTKAQVDLSIDFSTNKIDKTVMLFNTPTSHIKLSGKLESFSKPKFAFELQSTGIDVDSLINIENSAFTSTSQTQADTSKDSSLKTVSVDRDKKLDVLRKSEIARNAVGTFNFDIASLKINDIKINNIKGNIKTKNLLISLTDLSLGIWGGRLNSNVNMDLMPSMPTYSFDADIVNLSLTEAVKSKLKLFENTLFGNATFKIKGNGKSFNKDTLIKNLVVKGTMNVANGIFTTIDIGRIATVAINESIKKVSEKYKELQGKTISEPQIVEGAYETISSNFVISESRFSAPDFLGKAKPGKGLDVKGATTLGLINYNITADWIISDTYNLTKARDISLKEPNVNCLFCEDGVVKFPIKVRGALKKPDFSYGSVPEAFLRVAVNNVVNALKEKAKSEIKARVEKELDNVSKKLPPATQDIMKNLKKKLPF